MAEPPSQAPKGGKEKGRADTPSPLEKAGEPERHSFHAEPVNRGGGGKDRATHRDKRKERSPWNIIEFRTRLEKAT